ncbi:hypothetical protein [uncultured Methanobrevibacter sp.]|nr:hypothetical protein [uncultured Methanobrevibacter sp.]
MGKLEGKVAIVTGATSGMGRESTPHETVSMSLVVHHKASKHDLTN